MAQGEAEVSQSESPEPMRMRASFLTLAAVALAACSPPVPDSGAGVGFQDYDSYLREQEAAAATSIKSSFVKGAAAVAIPRSEGAAPRVSREES